jgi:predicted ATP-dependent endonuclease of OLD family
MKYTKFTIKNFKGIKKIELDLAGMPSSNIFSLVGLNESGKTSIPEAISLLQNRRSDTDACKMIHKSQLSSFTGDVQIIMELALDEEDEKKNQQILC